MPNYVPNYGLKNFLDAHSIQSQAGFIRANGWGYGQVEPNHLSGQATKEVYAQLPAKKSIGILENGQFAKYDYANNQVNFSGPGEWMLVWNEIKLYRDGQSDAEFAMIADNYQARVYSPFGYSKMADGSEAVDDDWSRQSRFYDGKDADGNTSITIGDKTYAYDDVTAAADPYEMHSTTDPFHILAPYKERMMKDLGDVNSMVPRLMKTHRGDIFTTNMIKDASVAVGDILVPGAADGILAKKDSPADGDMQWQVVKVYTMPDHQPGVKLMRIA